MRSRNLPPLHSLRAFEAAARHLNFEAAAEELHLDPSAISHQVRKLEGILNVTLFRRRPRPMTLTQSGVRLYPEIRAALDRMNTAVAEVSATQTSQEVTISMTMGFAAEWFTPRLPKLRTTTGLDILVDADNRPADLHGGAVDLAIRTQEAAGSTGTWEKLFDDRMIAVAVPDLLGGNPAQFEPLDLLSIPLIRYRWANQARAGLDWAAWFEAAGIVAPDVTFAATFSEESHAIRAAVSGQGAALLSERLVAARLRDGELHRIGTISLPAPPFWTVHRTDHPRAENLRMITECLRQIDATA